jgi:hypothetical protein
MKGNGGLVSRGSRDLEHSVKVLEVAPFSSTGHRDYICRTGFACGGTDCTEELVVRKTLP